MKIKGTSLTSTYDFVKNTFPLRLDEWLQDLPTRSRELYTKMILATHWYPIQEGMIIPTKSIAKLFYDGNEKKASYNIGLYSADEGLKGIYKIFIKIASPNYVLQRSSRIFKTYYDPIEISIIEDEDKHVILQINDIDENYKLLFDRISGWIFRILELINALPLEVKFTSNSIAGGKLDTKILVKWQ